MRRRTWPITSAMDEATLRRPEPPFKKVEASWAEQRAYLGQAVEALGDTPFADQARDHLKTLEPVRPDTQGFERVSDVSTLFETAHFSLRFDAGAGAIAHLLPTRTGRTWAAPDNLLGMDPVSDFFAGRL